MIKVFKPQNENGKKEMKMKKKEMRKMNECEEETVKKIRKKL